MKSILLGCYKSNAASDRVIRKCGGTLWREEEEQDGEVSVYYTILSRWEI